MECSLSVVDDVQFMHVEVRASGRRRDVLDDLVKFIEQDAFADRFMAICTQYRGEKELVVLGIWSEVAGVVVANQAGTAPDQILFNPSVVYTSRAPNSRCADPIAIVDGWSYLTRL